MKTRTKLPTAENTPEAVSASGQNWYRAARVLWAVLMVIAGLFLVTALPGYLQRIQAGQPGHGPAVEYSQFYVFLQAANTISSLFASVLSYALAVLLFRRRFENPAVVVVSTYLLLYGVIMTGPLEAWGSYWLGDSQFVIQLQALLMATPTIALLVLFPNGRFVPPWTRWLLLISVIWNLVAFFLPIFPYEENTANIYILGIFWFMIIMFGMYAQIYRYRRVSTPDERLQTRWVLLGFLVWVGYMLVSTLPYFYVESLPPGSQHPWWSPLTEISWWLSLTVVPVALTIAITRSKLWDIDIVINRALVYGGLTAITMGVYILIVGTLANLLDVSDNTLIAFVTTGLVAILFQPLRDRLQQGVNRLMYGERDNPVGVLSSLGAQLERTGSPEDALNSITETLALALKLPYVAIELGEERRIGASFGIPREEIYRLPLSYQSESVGYLLVAPRAQGERFSSSDLALLDNITHQAGAAAHAVKLTVDLQRSRQRLVTAQEEERRRLRRDLHDGLGPTLASLTLKMDAARNVLRTDPGKAESLLEELKVQTQDTIQDIRGLVYALRPPALDEFGLIGALQNHISSKAFSRPRVRLETPEDLPPLPAAYEVAIYRIVLEGLTNILRHADAENAIIRVNLLRDQIVLEIIDDGLGMPDSFTVGVGLASMRERTEELGGKFERLTHTAGTHLRAYLPLEKE
jgi:signal transduction histidine kinase